MAQALDFVMDDEAAAQVGVLRGLPTEDLRLLVLPELWLAIVGTILTAEPALVLGTMCDVELLAAHAAVPGAVLTGPRRDRARRGTR